MNVLILGGTQFPGKHVTDALLEKGHRVAHFNRGLREPLPREGVERIQGDRDSNLDRWGDRAWDAVVDTSCYRPQTAQASACDDGGTYDVTSARGWYTIGEVLEACARASASGAHVTWLDDAFLTENDVAQWSEVPLWVSAGGGARSIVNVEPARALVRGLPIRPLDRTVRDTLAWARGAGRSWGSLRAGLSPEREAKLLQRWRARAD